MKEQKTKTIKQSIEQEIKNKLFTYTHRFKHYAFQMELHPNDSREEMEESLMKIHLDED